LFVDIWWTQKIGSSFSKINLNIIFDFLKYTIILWKLCIVVLILKTTLPLSDLLNCSVILHVMCHSLDSHVFFKILLCPIWLPVFLLFFYTEPEPCRNWSWHSLDPIFLLVYWMRLDLNTQPFDRESSLLTTRPDWRPKNNYLSYDTFTFFQTQKSMFLGRKKNHVWISYRAVKDTFFIIHIKIQSLYKSTKQHCPKSFTYYVNGPLFKYHYYQPAAYHYSQSYAPRC